MAWHEVATSIYVDPDHIYQCLGAYNGDLYLLVKRYGIKGFAIYRSTDAGLTWSLVDEETAMFAGYNDLTQPTMAIDGAGVIHIGYSAYYNPGPGLAYYACYCTYDMASGTWTNYGLISSSSGSGDGDRVTVLNLDATENPFIIKGGKYDNQFYARRSSGVWTDIGWVSAACRNAPSRACRRTDGDVYFISGRPYYSELRGWKREADTGTWSSSTLSSPSPDGRYPAANGGSDWDALHFAYRPGAGNYIYHVSRVGESWSAAHQVVYRTDVDPGVTWLEPVDLCVTDDDELRCLYYADGYGGLSGKYSLFESVSTDGGVTWSSPQLVAAADASTQLTNSWFCYFQRPMAGAAAIGRRSNNYLSFLYTDDFAYANVYGPWETRILSGEDLEWTVM